MSRGPWTQATIDRRIAEGKSVPVHSFTSTRHKSAAGRHAVNRISKKIEKEWNNTLDDFIPSTDEMEWLYSQRKKSVEHRAAYDAASQLWARYSSLPIPVKTRTLITDPNWGE